MNEFLSVLRLKDKVVIVALMSVFALLLAGSATAVAMVAGGDSGINSGINGEANNGTENGDTHTHTYEYHVEKNDIGEFYFVGECTVENCQNPKVTYAINGGITEEIKTASTCHSLGEKVYYFTPSEEDGFEEIEYTYTEQIPLADHTYVGEIVADGDTVSVNASCSVEGCSGAAISVSGVADLELASSDAATCNTPRRDNYTFTSGGQTYNISTLVEEEGPHILNGNPGTDYEISSGMYFYGTPGVYPSDGVCCGGSKPGFYICEGCKEVVNVLIVTPPHSYEYSFDKITKQPGFDQTGEIQLDCTNEVCDHVETLVVPKAVENENTTSQTIDETNKKQTWKYSYTFEEYDFTVEFEFETDWEHDHIFVYDRVVKDPTIYRDGEFAVKCTICEKEKKHSIPKASADNADEIIEATEQNAKTYVYTYVSETYGFTEVFRVTEGNPLSHAYEYELVPYNGGFALKGTCEQPGCQETTIITDEGLVPDRGAYVAPTCTNFGYESLSYTKDGQTYVLELLLPPDESNHTFVCDESNTAYPSFESAGTTVMKCSGANCGVKTETITLPIAVIGDNALIDEESRTVIYTFVFIYNDIEFVAVAEYPLSEEHTHSYTYELIPMEGELGKFDFVGSCSYPLCTAKITDTDVPAVLEEDNSQCTTGINQIWSYTVEGVVYYCNLALAVPDGHHMDYVPNSPTTVNPTLDESGSMEIYCTKCGETYILELPPINDPDVIAEITRETERQISYSYIYHYVYNELDPDGFLDIDLIVLINK